jgi:hypothetical protein
MKLTKEQRHKHYKVLESILVKGTHGNFPWICNILSTEFKSQITDYPELIKRQPIYDADGNRMECICGYGVAWFKEEDVRPRIKIVRACIRETEPKPRKK